MSVLVTWFDESRGPWQVCLGVKDESFKGSRMFQVESWRVFRLCSTGRLEDVQRTADRSGIASGQPAGHIDHFAAGTVSRVVVLGQINLALFIGDQDRFSIAPAWVGR